MADAVCLPRTASGDALRRIIEARARERRRLGIAALAAIGAVPCSATLAVSPPLLLLWNASASTPRGLYRVFPGARVHRGDSVVAMLGEPYRTLAARRGYLPPGVPLVKRIAAVPGDRICAHGATITIAGKRAAVRRTLDARGRALPAWSGCTVLARGEFLLLGESPWSFDGRYFGTTSSAQIIGRAARLWRA